MPGMAGGLQKVKALMSHETRFGTNLLIKLLNKSPVFQTNKNTENSGFLLSTHPS